MVAILNNQAMQAFRAKGVCTKMQISLMTQKDDVNRDKLGFKLSGNDFALILKESLG